LKQYFITKYDKVKIIKYREVKREKIDTYIKSIKSMNNTYLYLTDFDYGPCTSHIKDDIRKQLPNTTNDRIIVVKRQIESWYAAGLDNSACRKLKIHFNDTEVITKEQFRQSMPNEFNSVINFMIEVLRYFSTDIARKRNASFDYFFRKFCVKKG
jgi:hypothetical protein